jgi:CIC family chloride channel protein
MAVCVVAVGAAFFAIGFRSTLGWIYRTAYGTDTVVEAIAALPWQLRFLVPTLGGLTAGAISLLRSRTQGVSNVMEAVALGNITLSARTTAWRVLASWTAIASGISIGREGPLIEFGGTFGASVGRLLRVSLTRTRVLVAAGTAAGFATAYNTPFAAVLFVFETILGIAAPVALVPTMSATVVAAFVARAAVGGGPIYGPRAFALGSPAALPSFALIGLCGSVAAVVFKRVLESFEEWFRTLAIPQPLRAAIGGAVVGAIAIWLPIVAGNGYEPLNEILDQQVPLAIVASLAIAKVIATSTSVASGIPGGIFTPVLLVGGALGTLSGHVVGLVWSDSPVPLGSYALVGMAATTAASIHAPLTAAVLVFELSGDYAIVLPLLLATVVSVTVSKAFGGESVYESELRRRGIHWELTLEGRKITPG